MNGELSEREILQRIGAVLAPPTKTVRVGFGDDTAVVEPPLAPLLLCSDALIENLDFRLEWSSPLQIGAKAAAAAMSDIAAMGGRAHWLLVTLALRQGLGADFAAEVLAGAQAVAKDWGAEIVGGDLARTKDQIMLDVTVVGSAVRPLSRAGAKPGDILLLSGSVGSSAAGLEALRANLSHEPFAASLLKRHLEPRPRFDLLPVLQTPGLVHALIDVSDGLASELHHLADASAVGFVVEETRVPVANAVRELAARTQIPLASLVWAGGEDYELLMAVDPDVWRELRERGSSLEQDLTVIGTIASATMGRKIKSKTGDTQDLPRAGWDPFC